MSDGLRVCVQPAASLSVEEWNGLWKAHLECLDSTDATGIQEAASSKLWCSQS